MKSCQNNNNKKKPSAPSLKKKKWLVKEIFGTNFAVQF